MTSALSHCTSKPESPSTVAAPRESVVEARRGAAEVVDQIAEEWSELCGEGPNDQPFYRPEWFRAYLTAFEPHSDLLLITARVAGRLKAVLPLLKQVTLFHGVPVRKLRSAANVHSCRFDLVQGAGADGNTAVTAVWRYLRNLSGWDLIELNDVPEGGAAQQLLQAAESDGFRTGHCESIRSPYIVLDRCTPSDDLCILAKNAHFRQNFRRRLRKAQAQYSVRLERVDTVDPTTLQTFFNLESAGWKGDKKTAILCSEQTRQFYQEIAKSAARFGYLSLYLLTFNNRAVAAHFGLSYRSCYYSPKVAYDENYASYGPGHLIVGAILQDCATRGVYEFDFLGPMMPWKAEWASTVRPHSNCYIFGNGLLGRALYAARFKIAPLIRNTLQTAGKTASFLDQWDPPIPGRWGGTA